MGSSVVQNANVGTGGAGSVTVTATTGGITMADGTVTSAAGTGAVSYQAPGTITLGLNAGVVIGLLAAPIDVNVGGQVNVNAGGSIFNPPGPVYGTSINMAGVDADSTLHFPTTVTGQIFWNGVLLWPLTPLVPGGGAAAAARAALQQGIPACRQPLVASRVAIRPDNALCTTSE